MLLEIHYDNTWYFAEKSFSSHSCQFACWESSFLMHFVVRKIPLRTSSLNDSHVLHQKLSGIDEVRLETFASKFAQKKNGLEAQRQVRMAKVFLYQQRTGGTRVSEAAWIVLSLSTTRRHHGVVKVSSFMFNKCDFSNLYPLRSIAITLVWTKKFKVERWSLEFYTEKPLDGSPKHLGGFLGSTLNHFERDSLV